MNSMRWRLVGERRSLPAHALSRIDLLDELHSLLGRDRDPLEAIRELTAPQWRVIHRCPFSASKHDESAGLVWRAEYHHHAFTLLAYPRVGEAADTSCEVRVCDLDGFDVPLDAILPFADYQIAIHRLGVEAAVWAHGRDASW